MYMYTFILMRRMHIELKTSNLYITIRKRDEWHILCIIILTEKCAMDICICLQHKSVFLSFIYYVLYPLYFNFVLKLTNYFQEK